MTLESPTPLEPAPRTSRMRETPAKTAGELTPIHFASVLLRHWVLVLLLPFLVALITGVDVLLRERTYTAVNSFLPQSQGN